MSLNRCLGFALDHNLYGRKDPDARTSSGRSFFKLGCSIGLYLGHFRVTTPFYWLGLRQSSVIHCRLTKIQQKSIKQLANHLASSTWVCRPMFKGWLWVQFFFSFIFFFSFPIYMYFLTSFTSLNFFFCTVFLLLLISNLRQKYMCLVHFLKKAKSR